MTSKLYTVLARLIDARSRCIENHSDEWQVKHEASIQSLINRHLPHGSGFDNGVAIDLERSTGEKLIFTTEYHHMDENGYYDGWTEHTITVAPSLCYGFVMTITGRNRNDIREVIAQSFEFALNTDVEG